jgi:hypothetical protein
MVCMCIKTHFIWYICGLKPTYMVYMSIKPTLYMVYMCIMCIKPSIYVICDMCIKPSICVIYVVCVLNPLSGCLIAALKD